MSDLVAFLRARLDEDEATAKAADHGRWLPEDKGVSFEVQEPDGEWALGGFVAADTHANADHIARHDPARVLREVEAGRMILAEHAAAHTAYREAQSLPPEDARRAGAATQMLVWERVLKIRAAVWRDHPDYDPQWRP
jgi:hypothetical protein